MTTRWAIEWYSKSKQYGEERHFIWAGVVPLLFRTRREARAAAKERWGYIAKRPDLRAEPHGWRMPRAVKVQVVLRRV